MLPLLKVFSLVVRVFVRPIVARTKKMHLQNSQESNGLMRRWFIQLGNYYHRQETRINRSFMRISTKDDFFQKPLSEDMAIEKGVEFFYELLIYGTLIGLPLYELYVSSQESKEKGAKLNAQLKSMEDGLKELHMSVEGAAEALTNQQALNQALQKHMLSLQGVINVNLAQLQQQNMLEGQQLLELLKRRYRVP